MNVGHVMGQAACLKAVHTDVKPLVMDTSFSLFLILRAVTV